MKFLYPKHQIILTIFLIVLFFVAPSLCLAQTSVDTFRKQIVIEKELNCVTGSFQKNKKVEWHDICYTNNQKRSYGHSFERAIEIENALDKASTQLNKQKINMQAPSPQVENPVIEIIPPKERPKLLKDLEKKHIKKPKKNTIAEPRAITHDLPLKNFEFGPEIQGYYYRQEEDYAFLTTKERIKNSGSLFGAFANYTQRSSQNRHIRSIKDAFKDGNTINMFRFEGRYTQGNINYSSLNSEDESGFSMYMLELRLLAGYDLPLTDKTAFTPYFGFGFRFRDDEGSGGYLDRESPYRFYYEIASRYYYMPLGLEIFTKVNKDWSLTFNFEYDQLLYGEQRNFYGDDANAYVYVSNDDAGSWATIKTAHFQQEKGYGLRGSFKIKKYNKGFDVFIEPFLRYWTLKRSEKENLAFTGDDGQDWYAWLSGYTDRYRIFEPANHTTEYGVRIGVSY